MMNLERTLTSLEVAEMVEREHKNVMRDIKGIIEHLGGQLKIEQSYFIESNYKNSQNKDMPMYRLTKKGCELYGTRMTGAKGTLFAVKYIDKFNEMEEQQKRPMSQLEIARMQLDKMIAQEKEMEELKKQQQTLEIKVDNFQDIIGANSDNWRKETLSLVKRIANKLGGNHMIKDVHNQLYEELENRAKCNLEIRLNNFKRRCEALGVPASKVKAKNKLDVINEDSKLVEIYLSIVKEFSIKYGI